MFAGIKAEPDLTINYRTRIHEDGGGREQSKVKMLDDGEQNADDGLQKTDRNNQKNLVRRSDFTVFKVSLGVMYLLALATVIIRLTLKMNELNSCYSQLETKPVGLPPPTEKMCPDGWKRFESSCYFKSTERKTWSESRKDCQERGADLVIINSKDEQEFLKKLTMKEFFWIGLGKTEGSEWKWVDGSTLTKFWGKEPQHGECAVCCDDKGEWGAIYSNYGRNWICEK
ncbi:C-type lectin domain family 2 member B-like isoform X2 [Melanotaenia boesemani]|uniref:C-type lectin domain family 2 member B-like isoform X2 n=1 Tax=Melanotaenia boesemani TaxID=1250792 RepID=UPI001C0452A5|nr:C-type lectin domain family 2 member B-like isoform X2 [Melanotaenia boesemani]